jgi:outer membrane murein-binding lipoprotein Lpp
MNLREGGRDMIRKTYVRKVEARLARLEEDIDRLRDRVAAPVGEIKERIDGEFPDLRSKAKAIRKQVRAVEEAGATNWGRLKNAVDEGLKDLGQAIDRTVEKLRKAGSGGP